MKAFGQGIRETRKPISLAQKAAELDDKWLTLRWAHSSVASVREIADLGLRFAVARQTVSGACAKHSVPAARPCSGPQSCLTQLELR